MAYSKAKLKCSGDKASTCFRSFWIGNFSFYSMRLGRHGGRYQYLGQNKIQKPAISKEAFVYFVHLMIEQSHSTLQTMAMISMILLTM
jgi:hypothetical protein